MVTNASTVSGGRSRLGRSSASRLPDQLLKYGLTTLAGLILAVLLYFLIKLISESSSTISHQGLDYVFSDDWNPTRNVFHAFSLVFGTLVSAAIALVLGVPVAISAALFVTELCPRRLRGSMAMLIDLLAAVPSVVYGLWGFFVLAPKLVSPEKWFARTFSFIPWIGGGTVNNFNYFIAGLILAIMILPIVSAISREVMATVPAQDKEAALALGATRWEMIRISVLPYARPGITGGAMLGLGRALGETIAVVFVIGSHASVGGHLFAPGASLAAQIASEFGEASNVAAWRSALFAAGLLLFILTLIVNVVARQFVVRGAHGKRSAGAGATGVSVAAVGQE